MKKCFQFFYRSVVFFSFLFLLCIFFYSNIYYLLLMLCVDGMGKSVYYASIVFNVFYYQMLFHMLDYLCIDNSVGKRMSISSRKNKNGFFFFCLYKESRRKHSRENHELLNCLSLVWIRRMHTNTHSLLFCLLSSFTRI